MIGPYQKYRVVDLDGRGWNHYACLKGIQCFSTGDGQGPKRNFTIEKQVGCQNGDSFVRVQGRV